MGTESKITSQKTEGTFSITSPYTDREHRDQQVVIKLIVNYVSRTFDIVPGSSSNGSFTFQKTSHKSEMWKATAQAIEKAIDFGNEQLELHRFSESNTSSN